MEGNPRGGYVTSNRRDNIFGLRLLLQGKVLDIGARKYCSARIEDPKVRPAAEAQVPFVVSLSK